MLVFTGVYVGVKAKLTLVSFFSPFVFAPFPNSFCIILLCSSFPLIDLAILSKNTTNAISIKRKTFLLSRQKQQPHAIILGIVIGWGLVTSLGVLVNVFWTSGSHCIVSLPAIQNPQTFQWRHGESPCLTRSACLQSTMMFQNRSLHVCLVVLNHWFTAAR